jgi:preprotein translocase subunit SecG
MVTLITIIHVIVCFFIIGIVLLQHGKSADIAATFGGTASQTAFGPRGSQTMLGKLTTWSAVIFMLTSITLSIFMAKRGPRSVLEGTKPAATQPAPQTPAPQAPNK